MAALVERYAEDKQLETTVILAPHLIRMNINHVIQDRLIKGMQGKCKLKAARRKEGLKPIFTGTAKDGFVIKYVVLCPGLTFSF